MPISEELQERQQESIEEIKEIIRKLEDEIVLVGEAFSEIVMVVKDFFKEEE
jgi:methyl-accepting chemotaxis protein